MTKLPRKQELLARLASFCGVTRVLQSLPGRPSLLILNYHRVGDRERTPYDTALFSSTTAELAWQIGWLKGRYPILTLDEAADVVHGRTKPTRTSVLITFDDGYLDNYENAFPVLRGHKVSGTFFLPTAFVGTGRLPWWDEIAYMVKGSRKTRLRLVYPEDVEIDLPAGGRDTSVAQALGVFKRARAVDTERFLSELEAASGCMRPGDHAERCFLNWEEAREMQAAGMCFGSHTHTHEILGRLTYERQLEELRVSKDILEGELGREIDALAYPRGKERSFSHDTFAALRATGYRTAFSFYSGVNVPGTIQPFDVLRAAVDGESRELFRFRAVLYANAGLGLP